MTLALPTANEWNELLPLLTKQEIAELNDLYDSPTLQCFESFADDYLKIQDKNDEIVPLELNRAQLHFITEMERLFKQGDRHHLLIKSRRVGMSTGIQGYKFYRQSCEPLRAMTMAHDQDTTDKMRRMCQLFYDNLPDEFPMQRTISNAATTIYMPHHSEDTIATAGGNAKADNKKSPGKGAKGRGGGYRFFHGSEVAFWKNTRAIIAGALQGLTKNGICVFETTVNGAQGWVWELVNDPGKWVIHFYPWWWDEDTYLPLDENEVLAYTNDEIQAIAKAKADGFDLTPEQIKWRRDKQHELKELFLQEYPEDIATAFLKSGGGAFTLRDDMFMRVAPAYDDAHRFGAGIDWGQDNDYTVLAIDDRNTLQEVYVGYWRHMEWSAIRAEIVKACKRFNVCVVRPEKNMASSNIENLANELFSAGIECDVVPFNMQNVSKNEAVQLFKNALDEHGLKLLDDPVIKAMNPNIPHFGARQELQSFQTGRTATGLWTYSAPEGGHDDTVIARILAWIALLSIE